MFFNTQIDLIILKTYDQQFTSTTKQSLHIIFKGLQWVNNVESHSRSSEINRPYITYYQGYVVTTSLSWPFPRYNQFAVHITTVTFRSFSVSIQQLHFT